MLLSRKITTKWYAFGMLAQNYNAKSYIFEFQNQENDDEIYGLGNSINFKYRVTDTRLGRFWSVDPLASKYPHNSTYAFSENRVINSIELEGLEAVEISKTEWQSSDGEQQSTETTNYNFNSNDQSIVLNYTNQTEPEKSFSITIPPFDMVADKPEPQDKPEEETPQEENNKPILEQLNSFVPNLRGNYQTNLEGEQGLIKTLNTSDNLASAMLFTPLAPIGEGMLTFSAAVRTGLDYKNKGLKQASINAIVRGGNIMLFNKFKSMNNKMVEDPIMRNTFQGITGVTLNKVEEKVINKLENN